jgi:predicted ATPase
LEALELARAIGHPFSLAYAQALSSWMHQYCRPGAEAEAAADELVRYSAEHGFTYWYDWGMLIKAGWMLLRREQEEGLALFLKRLDAFHAGGAALCIPYYLSVLGEAYRQAGRFQDSRRALDEGLAFAEKNDERFQEAELQRLKGELLLAESPDQAAAAENCFHQAIETARRQQSKAWELRATMSLARLWQRQGRRDEASAALAAVFDTYTEGFTTPDLVDAAALLEALA